MADETDQTTDDDATAGPEGEGGAAGAEGTVAGEEADEGTDGGGIESGPGEPATARTTAPQSPYTGRDVLVGAVVALVGLAITFGVPLLVG